jgi:predicted transposase YbfD/YdcC
MKWQSFLARFFNVSESEGIVSDDPSGAETFKTLINERQEKKLAALAGALSSEDDLGKVIRAHIHIEHELHELIILAAPSQLILDRSRKWSFSKRCS